MNDIDVPEYGAVFTFGKSGFAENFPSHFFIRNDPIIEIACGQQHTTVVCETGRVFSFGNNEWGQLGLGHRETINKPSCIKSLKPDRVKHVACGRVHTVFTTDNGKVYCCGRNTDGQLGIGDNKTLDYSALPMLVKEIDEEIIQVTAGSHHSLLLTAKGAVYGWGSNANGQLVSNKYEKSVHLDPTILPIPFSVGYISSNYYRSAFISDKKRLYTCGDEDDDDDDDDTRNQKQVLTEANVPGNIICVACGHHHNIVLTDSGICYTRGDNTFGQLGIDNLLSSSQWICVTFDEDVTINAISAGDNYSMFLTNASILYGCGDSRYGKLCINYRSENVTKPMKIQFSISNLKVDKVVCGERHTMVLARPSSTSSTLSSIEKIKNSQKELLNENEKVQTEHFECDYFIDVSTSPTNNDQKCEIENGNMENGKNTVDISHRKAHTAETNNDSKDSFNGVFRELSTPFYHDPNEIKTDETQTSDEEYHERVAEISNKQNELKNGETTSEGRFMTLLRQLGLRKISTTKKKPETISITYKKGLYEPKTNSQNVTSKVCVLQ